MELNELNYIAKGLHIFKFTVTSKELSEAGFHLYKGKPTKLQLIHTLEIIARREGEDG